MGDIKIIQSAQLTDPVSRFLYYFLNPINHHVISRYMQFVVVAVWMDLDVLYMFHDLQCRVQSIETQLRRVVFRVNQSKRRTLTTINYYQRRNFLCSMDEKKDFSTIHMQNFAKCNTTNAAVSRLLFERSQTVFRKSCPFRP